MRFCGIELLAVLLLLAGGCDDLDIGWDNYHSDEGSFSIDMPDEPETDTYQAATPSGAMTVYTAGVERDSVYYAVTYTDLPGYLAEEGAPEAFLAESRGWALAGIEGRVLADSSLVLDEYPGRLFLLEAGGGIRHRIHLYASGARLYQVTVVGPARATAAPRADRFFASFSIDR